MASTADFKNGLCLEFNNDIFQIVDFQHVKPGKGGAFVRTKLKNVKTGNVNEKTFRAGEKLQKAQIETSLSELTFLPANPIQLEDRDAEQALKLMDLLDENEDVSKVHANFEISDELMEKMAVESA